MTSHIWRAMLRAAGIRTWAIIGAAVVLTAFSAWLVWIVWRGGWDASNASQQLDIIGWMAWGSLTIIGLIVIALTGLGVVASVGKGGVTLNVGDEDKPPQATVTTTTETTVTAEPKV